MKAIARYGLFVSLMLAAIGSYAGEESSVITQNPLSAEELLERIKFKILSQAVNSGLSISSSGFIDSEGRLTESTFYETGMQVSGIGIPELLLQGREFDAEADNFIRSTLRESHPCAMTQPRYSNEVGIYVENTGWHSSIASGLSDDLTQTVMSVLDESVEQSLNWYTSRAPQDTVSPASTQYFSILNRANKDVRNARYLIKARIEYVRGRSKITNGLNELRSASAKLLLAASKSQLISSALASKSSDSFDIRVTLTFFSRDSRAELITHLFTLTEPASSHDLYNRRLSNRNVEELNHRISHFVDQLDQPTDCEFGGPAFPIQSDHISLGTQTVKINRGSVAGVRMGDRFILSAKPLNPGETTLSPEVIDSIAIGEVSNTNFYSATLEIVAGQTHKPYLVAIPF